MAKKYESTVNRIIIMDYSRSIQTIEDWLKFVRHSPVEFSIQYPPRLEYFMENYSANFSRKIIKTDSIPELLYVHVPFCLGKCDYCFFATDHRIDSFLMDKYVQAVLDELNSNPNLKLSKIRCIDIGGGTPTALTEPTLKKLLVKFSNIGACQGVMSRNIESTPQQLSETPNKVKIIKDAGFNRISMGVQSSSPSVLKDARRKQEWQHVVHACQLVRNAGIKRMNIDLIFGLPGQNLQHWKNDLNHILSLRPDSITVYDCLYRGEGRELISEQQQVPSIELMQKMYNTAYHTLLKGGYHAEYGSLNFSLRQEESGTSAYFERRLLWGDSYIGIGNYATSLLAGHWMFNTRSVDKYIDRMCKGKSPIEYHYVLPEYEQYSKYLLYSLNYGIILPEHFNKLFGCSIDTVYGKELLFAEEKGWIIRHNDRISIAPDNFANIYLLRSLLYSPTAKQWFYNWINEQSQK